MPEAATTPAPSDMPCAVLVVEDEPLLRLNAEEALSAGGFRCVGAADAGEALQKLRQSPGEIAIAVIDLGLPDLPGEALARRLREIRSDLPIVVASGYSPRRLRSLFAGMGGVAFLEKPYGTDELVDAVRAIVDARPLDSAGSADGLPRAEDAQATAGG